MSPAPGFAGRLPCRPWSVWRYNWLANHQLMRSLERVQRHARGTLLDVGCGTRPFAPLFRGHAQRYLGLDLPGSPELQPPLPDVFGDAVALPFRDGAFDTVLTLSVMNLLHEPARGLAEMRRVLAPEGVLIAEFVQMAPIYAPSPDLWRFTRPGVERLLREAGLEPVEILAVGHLPTEVGLAVIGWLNRVNRGPWRVLTELPVRLLYVLVQALAALLELPCAGSHEVVAHVVVARRAAPRS